MESHCVTRTPFLPKSQEHPSLRFRSMAEKCLSTFFVSALQTLDGENHHYFTKRWTVMLRSYISSLETPLPIIEVGEGWISRANRVRGAADFVLGPTST